MSLSLYHLFGLGEANSAVVKVIHAVPFPQERVTQDSQRANGFGEIHADEGADAGALDLQGVVVGSDREVVATQGEGKIGQRRTLVTLDRVLAREALLGTDFLVTGGTSAG